MSAVTVIVRSATGVAGNPALVMRAPPAVYRPMRGLLLHEIQRFLRIILGSGSTVSVMVRTFLATDPQNTNMGCGMLNKAGPVGAVAPARIYRSPDTDQWRSF
ncbi:hypothetical protein GCM10010505_77520 [Kitasatospora aburaviensis]